MRSTLQSVVRPIQDFFRLEAASGILLFATAVAALLWANSPLAGSYRRLFSTPLAGYPLRAFINDGLMAFFFLLVGLEIKRELVTGELRTFRRAVLPAVAALGGMLVPAAIFLLLNGGGPGAAGWGIPVATDIAFSIGCLTLMRKRVPHALIVFLTALAIFDDIGGILVIAFFYGEGLRGWWLLAAGGITAGLYLCNRLQARAWLYGAGGVALWYALHASGVHATIAGVVLGLMVPARMPGQDERPHLEAPLGRFLRALHPGVAFGIVPLFALANSGVALGSAETLTGPVALGVALGLVLGKPIGILAATWLAVRSRLSPALAGASWLRVAGVAAVGGIGFTVALFIAALAYPATQAALLDQAKAGIVLGSAAAGTAGMLLLRLCPPTAPDD